ncbi:MAG: ABC transporter, permease protein 2 (cluster 5, nickel/peptides/opines), partial [uncultured Thermomicrobiales bacterium]
GQSIGQPPRRARRAGGRAGPHPCRGRARLLPAQPAIGHRNGDDRGAAAGRDHRPLLRRHEEGRAAQRAAGAATLPGISPRHRRPRARPAGGDGQGPAADAAGRLPGRRDRPGDRHDSRLRLGLPRRPRRRRHPDAGRHRPDRARPADPDHDRRLDQGLHQREHHGAGDRLAGLAPADAHGPLAGTHPARAGLCAGGAALGDGDAGDHRPRAAAESPPLPRRELRRRGQLRHPGLDRPGGAGARAAERSDPRDDRLLGNPVQRAPARAVVVVAPADLRRRDAHPRAHPADDRTGRDRQPEAEEGRM